MCPGIVIKTSKCYQFTELRQYLLLYVNFKNSLTYRENFGNHHPEKRTKISEICNESICGRISSQSNHYFVVHSNLDEKVTSNEQKLASNEQKVMSNPQKVTSNGQKVTSNEQKVVSNAQKVTRNKQKVTRNKQKVARNKQKVTKNEQKVTSNEQKVQPLVNRSCCQIFKRVIYRTPLDGWFHVLFLIQLRKILQRGSTWYFLHKTFNNR